MKNLVIAVDGPAGAGKSTIAKLIAEKLKSWRFLQTMVYIPKKMFWDRNLLFLPRFLPGHVWRD